MIKPLKFRLDGRWTARSGSIGELRKAAIHLRLTHWGGFHLRFVGKRMLDRVVAVCWCHLFAAVGGCPANTWHRDAGWCESSPRH